MQLLISHYEHKSQLEICLLYHQILNLLLIKPQFPCDAVTICISDANAEGVFFVFTCDFVV